MKTTANNCFALLQNLCKPDVFLSQEIYKNEEAYKTHLLTPHFLKYKIGTAKMVKSLELVETDPLIPGMMIKQ